MMGTSPRIRPQRLAEKLRYIRQALNLSQVELMRQLAIEAFTTQSNVSEYESGKREPSSLILLQYARLARVHLEDLIDDEENLPAKLPGRVKHKRLKPKAASGNKRA
jgi:transcriptional regulator with XRE-family HTH domain